MQASTQQSNDPGKKWLFWQRGKSPKAQTSAPVSQTTDPENFYERAIEWTHRADKVINLILGYLLAIASVLGFMDVLSNGQVLGRVPNLFYVWLGIMGLGVDFQILLVVGRVPDLARMANASWQKWTIFLFNAVFLMFLAYMSVIIGAIFTQHRDDVAGSTIAMAMSTLHIDATYFVYERAALATLLLVLMAIDRTMERWRMQCAKSAPVAADPLPEKTEPVQPTQELEKVLQAMVAMNQQNLQALAEMNRQAVQDALQQSSRVTVELVRETVDRSIATIALTGHTPAMLTDGIANTPKEGQVVTADDSTCSGEQQEIQSDKPKADGETWTPGPAICSGEQESEQKEDRARYGPLIEGLYQRNTDITVTEIVDELGCSRSTASKWLQRVKPVTQ